MHETHTPLLVETRPDENLNTILADRLAADPQAVLAEARRAPGADRQPVSVGEFAAEAWSVAKGLVALGVEPGSRVGIMSRTRYGGRTQASCARRSTDLIPLALRDSMASVV